MPKSVVVLGAVAAALVAGCAPADSSGPQAEGTGGPSTGPEADAVSVPPDPEPVAEGPCPYLDTETVAEANGQRVRRVRVSDDEPHPACFFHRPDGEVQLTVRVYVGDPAVAVGVVDAAAPVENSNPATRPSGWEGGYRAGDDGAVYAISKGDTAVVVTTNQRQSVKARSIATTVVHGIGA
ncbi:DUF2020 domain-containing protein [Saccharomonospora saliphila]|uniref:DUF2020 domain-containing protein n=1 Tax=Saccharomonospora saliphila TaxID=369829 RepID=UPI0003733A24|nr:DUF2020 domain-containing protein [Saccharomonospora saliphila]